MIPNVPNVFLSFAPFRPKRHHLSCQRFPADDFNGITPSPGFITLHPGLLRLRTFGALYFVLLCI